MQKVYRCRECGKQTEAPVYVRLVLTRCGLEQAKAQQRHLALPVGHVCRACLSSRVRAAGNAAPVMERLKGFLAM